YKHIAGLVIGFVLISLIFLVGGERLINKPLRALTNVMKKVESGDLSVRAEAKGRDEFAYLSSAFNSMIDTLASAKQEIEIFHMQQMERAAKLASLGEIISGIAHEIKNPLTGISCAVQVFNSELADDDSRKPVITEVLNQVKRLDRIVKDLLSYAKPKTPVFVPSKIHEILEKTLFFVYPKAKNQHIAIENQVGKEIPEILMDPDQMHQIFLNIIINAIQSMPDGGVLTISSIVSPDFVEISIEDTGKGISSEDLPYLFEPFFTRKAQGTGLGLSISRKIVQEHGGEIIVESEVGRGSAFTVYLPMKDKIKN
ncbi:MAG: ATP-binding protein, partial [Nitrospirota bacterium]|nr:ATP-binding protein [Nitrospirota bacterium]